MFFVSQLFLELNNLMLKYHFKPNKKLSQHFIVDENILQKIVAAAELKPNDVVLEIGPGTGFLTRELLKKCKVVAIELDSKMCELLQDEFKAEIAANKLHLIHGNFLNAKLPNFNKVVSNAPYTYSSETMMHLVDLDFELAVMTFQQEFVGKLTAFPGFAEYCATSVITQNNFDIEIILPKIGAGAFFPAPRAFSSTVRFVKKKGAQLVENELLFEEFVKSLFRYKNKNLSNALQKSFSFLQKNFKLSKTKFESKLTKVDNLAEKVNLLEPKEFVELYNLLQRK